MQQTKFISGTNNLLTSLHL